MKKHFLENYPTYFFGTVLLFCFIKSIQLRSGEKRDKWKQPPGG